MWEHWFSFFLWSLSPCVCVENPVMLLNPCWLPMSPLKKKLLSVKMLPLLLIGTETLSMFLAKKTVDFVTVDGNKKKRSGIILREFVFTHVSLPLKSQNVQEQNLFLGWLDTSLETKVFLYTKADNKKIDYLLYKLSPKGEKVILQEGTFSA